MSEPTPIVMFGAAGRMGRMILDLAAGHPDRWSIAGAVDHSTHPLLGQPLSALVSGAPAGLTLQPEGPPATPAGTVAIHFSLPEGTLRHLEWCRAHGIGALVGTTGMSSEQRSAMEAAAADIPLLITSNFSRGVAVLAWLVAQATRLLGPDYDIEIIEMHHHHKKDAPSGTARTLAQAALGARGGDLERDLRHGRAGIVGERTHEELGMHAVRAGDIVGDHTVLLAGPGERLELTHRAHSREVFAWGALEAARWLAGRQPGLYTMQDVLGLSLPGA